MKNYLTGLMAVIIAIGAFAFTAVPKESAKTNYYWFELKAVSGNPKDAVGLPPLQASDPFTCPGGTAYCAGAYSGYIDNHNGTYSASGSRIITDMKH